MKKKGSIKVSEKRVGGKKRIVMNGKNLVVTSSPCAVCSQGSDISVKGGKGKKNKIKTKVQKTCYSHNALLKIAEAYNKSHKDKIQYENKSDSEVWNIIRNKLVGVCSYDEHCWKKQEFVKKLRDTEINLYTFKPEYPKAWKKNPSTWLNTYDILYVMKQYEKAYDDFIFNGVVPSDCPTSITCELSNIDIKKMIGGGIKRMGVVFNTDVSTGPGQHWIAFYMEFNKKKAELNFFDSYGDEPQKNIKQFIIDTAEKFEKEGIKPTIIYNDKRHQYGGSQCGVYSMNFLLERLNGTSMYDISKMNILDKEMENLRKVLYLYEENEKKGL